MEASDRLLEEIRFHDQQAHERAERLREADLAFSNETYLEHESWIRPAIEKLGEIRNCDLLDLGCGHAMAAIVFARVGARVTALDLSSGYLAEAQRRAHRNGVKLELVQADAERLPFTNASFDRIWGNAILHHLHLDTVAHEIHRVLRPGGVAVFAEPWGENPLLEWARQRLPYPGKSRTRDERPLRASQLDTLREHFPRLQVQGYQLLSMAGRVLGQGPLVRALAWCDDRLLRQVPTLHRWCRYVVLTLPRD